MPLSLEALAVFPLFPVTDGVCTCRAGPACERPAKHPMFLWSQLEAGEKWQGPAGCGYGIATGIRSGFFVVDLDVRADRDGVATFEAMGDCEPTYTVRTPTSGFHLYFQLPDFLVRTSGNELAPGIDIRGEGGFVVAQDSPHKNGGVYAVARDLPIAPAPTWLLEWAGLRGSIRNAKDASANAPIPINLDSELGHQRLEQAISYLKEAPVAIDGAGGSVCLLRICIELVRGLELPIEACFSLLRDHYNERCQPPWSVQELMHKLESARDQCDRIQGKAPEDWTARVERMASPVTSTFVNLPPMLASDVLVIPRQSVAEHRYSFAPGTKPPPTTLRKLISGEVAFGLTNDQPWRGVLQFNEFTQRVIAVNPPLKLDAETTRGFSDDDVDHIRMYLQNDGALASADDVRSAIKAAARSQTYHPVKEYLNECVREPGILDHAASRIFGTNTEHANMFFRKTMIAAVRRILRPGCQVDTVLVLHGRQGEGKSTIIKVLFGEEFTRSQMPDLSSKDASGALIGFWCIELAELDRVLRAETSTVKDFISRTSDDYRPPYGHCEVHAPRQCILIGTCNVDEFLKDSTGNRRFLPISVEKVDLEYVREFRNAMWGEALYLAEQGETHWLTRQEDDDIAPAREAFIQRDPWHDDIEDFLKGKELVKLNEIYENCIARGVADRTKFGMGEQKRLADTLRRLGCVKVKANSKIVWKVPETLHVLQGVDISLKSANAFIRSMKASN